MKGKNKILLVLFALCALVATSVGFALHTTGEIQYANAAEIPGFTAEVDGGIIFSAERVYFSQEDKSGTYNPTYQNVATESVTYGNHPFTRIETKQGTRYFSDFGLTGYNGHDYSHKHVIHQGDFVMVDDTAKLMADDSVTAIRQGIMITFGGYFKDGNTYVTNADKNEKERGAKISFVSAQAFLNGDYNNPLELPGARGYNDGEYYEDFTWFIPATKENEGHYEISFQYMKSTGDNNESEALKYEFDFYLLLNSSYTNEVEVVNKGYVNKYASKPTIDGAYVPSGQKDYEFNLGGEFKYPTLTFDYSRYDLTITHNSGDVTTTIDFNYDESKKVVTLSKKVYNDVKVDTYKIGDWGNTIISLMFSDHGRYEFSFDYIYKYKGEKITIPQSQIPFNNMILNIRGFQLKYSKAGFTSGADMTYLEIYQSNTMFVLLNGLINPNSVYNVNGFGVEYKLISPLTNERTGDINLETSKTASFKPSKSLTELDESRELDNLSYPKTDRGLWLTVNDEPDFSVAEGETPASYYYYNPYNKIRDLSDANTEDSLLKREAVTKVTTFTKTGYYVVVVESEYNIAGEKTLVQYYSFQITQATPILNLYKTNDDEIQEFYAYEFTNQNVFANWKDTEIFESTVVGKLYWSKDSYADEKTLVSVADGAYNSKISKKDYNKNDLITESASYLLVLEVQRSATKTYTYFTIDKDKISGLEVYEIATGNVDNHAIYRIRQDASLNYVKHTSKGIIDTSFTLDWANKLSGAKISATYKFTPFVKNNTTTYGKPISSNDDNYYRYIINAYGVDKTSKPIEINKPRALNVLVDVSNVLSDQGIYEFYLEDQAGNKLQYVVIIDKTEAVINATYGEPDENNEKRKYANGQMVADFVELEWGTHKAIDLSELNAPDSVIEDLLELSKNNTVARFEDYYIADTTNLNQILTLFKHVPSGEDLFVVEHKATNIKSVSFSDYYYRLRSVKPSSNKDYPESDLKSRVYESGNEYAGWDDLADNLFMTTLADKKNDKGEVVESGTDVDLKVLVDKDKLRRYTVEILGANNINNNANTRFALYITPDDALGEVYSSSQENADFNTTVLASGQTPKYFEGEETYQNINMTDYYEAQASNDGVFVFEWTNPQQGDNFNVVEVVYSYYQLMDQTALNNIDKFDDYPYYPYKYSRTEYLLQLDELGAEISAQYSTTTRSISDGSGKSITRSINRSNPINMGYESFYDENNELVKRKVTQTGLYIITRTIEIEGSLSKFSYAFFVDRNMIVGYDLNDVTTKLVGQFIHVAMPNSNSATGVTYDNFTKQGLPTHQIIDDGKQVNYHVYLETNKLPTQLKVPSGKYVSGNSKTEDEWDISRTSYININLRLSVYFVDTYQLLRSPYNQNTIQLMDEYKLKEHAYIDLDFSKLNTGEVGVYKQARIHNKGDRYLSLPGTYVFVLKDNVGKDIDIEGGTWELQDYNQFVFGIKLLNNAPATDVYAYASINNKQSSKIYSENMELYTNQEFVDFIIPNEDTESYMAQLDIGSVLVERKDLSTGSKSVWLKLIKDEKDGSIRVDSSGIQNTTKVICYIDKDGNELDYGTSSSDFKPIGYKIKLDTGLQVEDGKIVSYKEYEYYVYINYILKNSGTEFYTYQDSNFETLEEDKFADERITNKSFWQSKYVVTIDRTPNDANLNVLMKDQGEYFGKYQQWLKNSENIEDVNQDFAYRSSTTIADYYGLANALYYEYAKQTGDLSNHAMYALSVGEQDSFDISGLRSVYYREINFNDDIIARERMGLLPITDTYFTTSEYYTFNESTTAYNKGFLYDSDNMADSYKDILIDVWKKDSGALEGKFFEIVEIDKAGNYTQYVIYYTNAIVNPTIDVVGTYISGSSTDEKAIVEFTSVEPYTFIGIDYVGNIAKLASERDGKYEQYYANINIYDASRKKIKTIYTNSKSTHAKYNSDDNVYENEGIEKDIYQTIKDEGNYIIEFVNTFGRSYRVVVNNYTNADHQLNTSTFAVKKDINGNYYLTFSELNTKINKDTFWYVTNVEVRYGENSVVKYIASLPDSNGIAALSKDSAETKEVWLAGSSEPDRVNLAKDVSYTIILKDVGRKTYAIPISTIKDYYAYELIAPTNSYIRDNVVYTAGTVTLSYDKNLYNYQIEVLNENDMIVNDDVTDVAEGTTHNTITLKPDDNVDPTYLGSLRKFTIELRLINASDTAPAQTYVVYIDTRATIFSVSNINKEDKSSYIKSRLKNSGEDYRKEDFINPKYDNESFFGELINETITINWTDEIKNDYFTYTYELYIYKSASEVEIIQLNGVENYPPISPSDENTGKYIFKVEIRSKDGSQWIASRVYGIHMSTTVTGLYEVTDALGKVYGAYSAITNLTEILKTFNMSMVNIQRETKLAEDLKFEAKGSDYKEVVMQKTFNSFGTQTAIPMYISNEQLLLQSNKDNGVDASCYTTTMANGTVIKFYRVYRSNYQTFVVLMEVPFTRTGILSTFEFATKDVDSDGKNVDPTNLLGSGMSKTIYDASAQFHRLTFSSYNKNAGNNPLEQHNKIVISVYYNNKQVNSLIGGNGPLTDVYFKNSGSYKLEIRDMAGNVQYFTAATSSVPSFLLVVMKDVLYTINAEAPIQYAYYDKPVRLQINRQNNYDINEINLTAVLNSRLYTGYEHPTGTSEYTFKDYGTYLITMSAKLLNSEETVTSQLVFTILNPNEARRALDFTSISSYDIVKVERVYDGVNTTADVTETFMTLLQDKANSGDVNVYNKLVTYERVVDAFKVPAEGKMKFKVSYRVQDDVLLPARYADFTFTLNNETATINASIAPGGKTTKPVVIEFNPAIIYELVGDCYLVINGERVNPKIDANSLNDGKPVRREIKEVGHYYVQLVSDSGNVITSFNFTIKEPLNAVSIILIVIVSAIVIGLVGTFIWLRTRMKVR